MRIVLIPVICLLLGLAAGYAVTSTTMKTEVTPAMIEEGLRENPRMLLDLLQQYPVEVFDVVVKGQELKRRQDRDEQILAQLMDPLEVDVSADRPVRGDKNAPLTIVEFSDFQCPHCAKAGKIVEEIIKNNPSGVNQVFLHMPLSSHEMAPMAAAFFEAISLQDEDKAWQFHDIVFAKQGQLKKEGAGFLHETAESLGLDMEKLQEDLSSDEVSGRLQADMETAKKLGLRGTPSYVIGGVLVSGAMPKKEFQEVIELIQEHRAATAEEPAAQ